MQIHAEDTFVDIILCYYAQYLGKQMGSQEKSQIAAHQEGGVGMVETFSLWVSGSPFLGVLFFKHDFPKLKKNFFDRDSNSV